MAAAYGWRGARKDVLAGLTVAAISLPQAMAYALIAGIDPRFGLYSAIVVTAIASIFSSSSHLINGPTNAISLVVFSALAFLGPDTRWEAYEATFLLALMVGGIQILVAVFRLGDLPRPLDARVPTEDYGEGSLSQLRSCFKTRWGGSCTAAPPREHRDGSATAIPTSLVLKQLLSQIREGVATMSVDRMGYWFLIVVLACWPLQAAAEAQTGPIGVAKVDITPETPVRMAGYASRTTESEGVAGRLMAAALAIGGDEGDGPAVLLTVDSEGVPAALRAEVLRRVQAKMPLKSERLMLCNAHIHSGPDLEGMNSLSGQHREHLDRYAKELTDRLEEVVLRALASRKPGRLAWT